MEPWTARSRTISRRNRNSLAGRPRVSEVDAPVASTRPCWSTRRRKFCLCIGRPASAFDGALELQQGELRRHQLEEHRAVFDLGPEPRNAGGEDAAMVVAHRHARHGLDARWRRAVPFLQGFRYQARLVEQLIALQDQILVPVLHAVAEIDVDPLPALAPAARNGVDRCIGPCRQAAAGSAVRPAASGPAAPVLPGEIAIPALPSGLVQRRPTARSRVKPR